MAGANEVQYPADAAAKRRADHASENAEDYVELIVEIEHRQGAAHVVDVAASLGVSHVTVHKTLKRLQAIGLVVIAPYRAIRLTEEGRVLARQSRQRHEVTLRFLKALGVEEPAATNDAEGIEHHVSPALLEQMKRFCDSMESKGAVSKADLNSADA